MSEPMMPTNPVAVPAGTTPASANLNSAPAQPPPPNGEASARPTAATATVAPAGATTSDPHTVPAEASLERFDPLAAFASYAIPGLGQLLQGRTAKGILFMVCLPLLFYYGLFLGSFSNVYMVRHPSIVQSLYARPVFAAQFFIGVPAWPAIYEYARARSEMRQPIPGEGGERGRQLFGYGADLGEAKLNDLQRAADKRWDLGWVCTLIAGVLNILVIYDAFAGPAVTHPPPRPQPKPTPDSPTTSESMP
jgi:hypothetical protein